MEKIMWELIDKTKKGQSYMPSALQYETLKELLWTFNAETVQNIRECWDGVATSLRSEEFDKLHISRGGIVEAGDDGFYMDFLNWVVAQGKDLVVNFKEKGHTAILDYIALHNVKETDYLFECMAYAFHERL